MTSFAPAGRIPGSVGDRHCVSKTGLGHVLRAHTAKNRTEKKIDLGTGMERHKPAEGKMKIKKALVEAYGLRQEPIQ